MLVSCAAGTGRVASETRREGSEQRRRSGATPSSGAPEQRSIATQIDPVPGYDDALRRWPWAWHNEGNNFAEVRVMRTILVGVVAMMVVAVAGPAFAGPSATAKGCNPGAMEVGGAVHYTNPTGRVSRERRTHGRSEGRLPVP